MRPGVNPDGRDTPPSSSPGLRVSRKKTPPKLTLGDSVMHRKFGEGVIISLEQGGELAVIRFADDGAERRLMLAYAPLEKIT